MNKKNLNTGLYWFRHDCRLNDMPALIKLNSLVDRLICVYVYDEEWFKLTSFTTKPMGELREIFVQQGLDDLDDQLNEFGQRLTVSKGEPLSAISKMISEHGVSHVGCSDHSGSFERAQLASLKQHFPDVTFISDSATLLYEEEALPFSITDMPNHFSPFRRKVEKYSEVSLPLPKPTTLKPLPEGFTFQKQPSHRAETKTGRHTGGETPALKQLSYYLTETKAIAQYKETRNGMLGWDFSSKLSAWLANGHLSPRTVASEIKRFEQTVVANDSTYWLFFELLWREFFHWQLMKHKNAFFCFSGIQGHSPGTQFDADRFNRWCQGNTGYDIVDACMKELNATGFMSNRGRQLVASCFVHELNLDWRYGAAYFEQQLIDFDVASNYGNWQYLAGVGSDPRGHRQFNLDKQTAQYDPKGLFRRQWLT